MMHIYAVLDGKKYALVSGGCNKRDDVCVLQIIATNTMTYENVEADVRLSLGFIRILDVDGVTEKEIIRDYTKLVEVVKVDNHYIETDIETGEQKFGPAFVVTIRKPNAVDPLTSLENTVDNMVEQQKAINNAFEDIKNHVK